MSNLAISFSGGRSSAVMTKLILDKHKDEFNEITVVFCNTGQEHEATLEFVKNCDEQLDFNAVWLEARTHLGQRKGCTHRIVDFNSADRKGRVFENMAEKYGMPGQGYPHCTRELKLNPFKSYLKSIGWKDYKTAIGIRADEIDRMTSDASIIYPLITGLWDKERVNQEMKNWPFDLEIPNDAHGNCVWCWKKSFRKLYTLAESNPEYFNFPRKLENNYNRINEKGENRRLFRGGKTVDDIFSELNSSDFERYKDDTESPQITFLDLGGGCGDSCEITYD